ncbi:MAG: DivIVA domain-containing protein [Acidimicrobiales bacterium]
MVSVEQSLSADLIAQQTFPPARRGFNQDEVRAFLARVAAEMVVLHKQHTALEEARRDAEYRAAHPSFDEDTLLGAVGQETAAILKSAHEAAADIKARAGESASRILKDAHQQADALRAEAETVLARRTEEAEAFAVKIRDSGRAESERLVDQARQQAKAIRAQAEAERNAMVEGAQLTREKILSTLSKKRNIAVAQVEALRAGRERLLSSYEIVKRTLDEAMAELGRAEADARAAAASVRHKPLSLDEADALEDEEPPDPTLPLRRLGDGPPPPSVRPTAAGLPAKGAPSAPGWGAAMGKGAPPGPVPATPSPTNAGGSATKTSNPNPPLAPVTAVPRATGSPVTPTSTAPPPGAKAGANPAKVSPTAPMASPTSGATGAPPPVSQAAASPTGTTETPPKRDVAGSPPATTPEVPPTPAVKPAAPMATSPAIKPAAPMASSPPAEPPKPAASHAAPTSAGPAPAPQAPRPVPAPPKPADGAESPTKEVGAKGTGNGSVDSLFARIRADRERAVTQAREVLGEGPNGTAVEQGGERQAPSLPPVERQTPPPRFADRPIPDSDEGWLQRRDELLGPIEANLTRRLKRALQDDQNDRLDRLRSLRSSQRAAAVLADRETNAERFRSVARPFLTEAFEAGTAFTSSFSSNAEAAVPDSDRLAEVLTEAIVEPLRKRLEVVLAGGQGDDPVVLAEAVGAAYREWKTKRVEVVAADHVANAFNAGAYAALPPGAEVRWLVDDAGGPCPDCDDNALADGQGKGEAFPTGQRRPPAHPGCRCLLVPPSEAG